MIIKRNLPTRALMMINNNRSSLAIESEAEGEDATRLHQQYTLELTGRSIIHSSISAPLRSIKVTPLYHVLRVILKVDRAASLASYSDQA